MYLLKAVFNEYGFQAFQVKSQHLFYRAIPGGNMMYLVLGSLLLICASFFKQGQFLQQQNELTR